MIDLEFVRGLIEAVDRSGIDSLEISRAGTRIRISKSPPAMGGGAAASNSGPAASNAVSTVDNPQLETEHGGAAGATAVPATSSPPAATAPIAEPPSAVGNLTDVLSPMVGTFYRSPSPDAPPYVEVGTRVSTGQTLCILEAMKLMNELESEVSGVIREVLVENSEPVEYGQVLFRIET